MNTRLIIAAVAVIGISGCASQGGGKLDHDEVMAAQNLNNTIEVCTQVGAVMSCYVEDREQVRDELEYRLQSLNNQR